MEKYRVLNKDGINKAYYQVKEFHEAFGHPVAEKPTPMDVITATARQIWKAEEIVEFLHATARGQEELFKTLVNELISGICDAVDKQLKKGIVYETDEDVLVAQADALTDINYFNQGDFVVMGVKPQPLFDIVQRANMGKLWEDGKPRYREDGKILKPANWEQDFAPEKRLREEVKRQKGQQADD